VFSNLDKVSLGRYMKLQEFHNADAAATHRPADSGQILLDASMANRHGLIELKLILCQFVH
jgi:hypothetical protein